MKIFLQFTYIYFDKSHTKCCVINNEYPLRTMEWVIFIIDSLKQ